MKRFITFLTALLIVPIWAMAQAPTGFYYTAAIYQNGKPMSSQNVTVQITLKNNAGQQLFGPKDFSTQTDAMGVVNVLISDESNALLTMDWSNGVTIHPSVSINGEAMTPLSPVNLAAVPYAMNAVAGMTIKSPKNFPTDKPLFAVQDADGKAIFEVTRNGVTINVNDADATRGPRGGFAVNSRSRGTLMELNNGSATFNISDGGNLRGPRGGFAVNMLSRQQSGMSTRAEESTSSTPLMSISVDESFFTLSSCDKVNSLFTLRDRCNNNKPIFGVTNGGTIVSNDTVVVKAAGNIQTASAKLDYKNGTPPITQWNQAWHPYVAFAGNPDKGYATTGYDIEVQQGTGQQLVEVVDVKTLLNGKVQMVKGLKLKVSIDEAKSIVTTPTTTSRQGKFFVTLKYSADATAPGAVIESNIEVSYDFDTPNDPQRIGSVDFSCNPNRFETEKLVQDLPNVGFLTGGYSVTKVEGDFEGWSVKVVPTMEINFVPGQREGVTLTLPKDKLEEIMNSLQPGTSSLQKSGRVWLKNSKGEEGYIDAFVSFML